MVPLFHHVGYGTASLEISREIFENLGYRTEGPIFYDDVLGVQLQFMVLLDSNNTRIALIEDLPNIVNGPILKILKQRTGLYHMAFEVDSIKDSMKAFSLQPLTYCLPATAFNGRHIRFFLTKDGGIVELISLKDACECLGGSNHV